MSKLSWDASGERRYELGCDHGVLYTSRATGADAATKAFTSASAWNGLTAVTDSPSGADANDIYADNILYASLRAAEKFGGTIEAYTYPDAFAACNGEVTPTGVLGLRVGQQSRAPFGFVYRSDVGDDTESSVDPDKDYEIHIWWNCTASPSEKQYSTINESPDAMTMSWEVSCLPSPFKDNPTLKPTSWMVVDAWRYKEDADKAKLQALENILFGKDPTTEGGNDGITPYLPTPDEVIAILKNGVPTT